MDKNIPLKNLHVIGYAEDNPKPFWRTLLFIVLLLLVSGVSLYLCKQVQYESAILTETIDNLGNQIRIAVPGSQATNYTTSIIESVNLCTRMILSLIAVTHAAMFLCYWYITSPAKKTTPQK